MRSALGEAVFDLSNTGLPSPQSEQGSIFNWTLTILPDPSLFFLWSIDFGGIMVKFHSSIEIALFLLSDNILQFGTPGSSVRVS